MGDPSPPPQSYPWSCDREQGLGSLKLGTESVWLAVLGWGSHSFGEDRMKVPGLSWRPVKLKLKCPGAHRGDLPEQGMHDPPHPHQFYRRHLSPCDRQPAFKPELQVATLPSATEPAVPPRMGPMTSYQRSGLNIF